MAKLINRQSLSILFAVVVLFASVSSALAENAGKFTWGVVGFHNVGVRESATLYRIVIDGISSATTDVSEISIETNTRSDPDQFNIYTHTQDGNNIPATYLGTLRVGDNYVHTFTLNHNAVSTVYFGFSSEFTSIDVKEFQFIVHLDNDTAMRSLDVSAAYQITVSPPNTTKPIVHTQYLTMITR